MNTLALTRRGKSYKLTKEEQKKKAIIYFEQARCWNGINLLYLQNWLFGQFWRYKGLMPKKAWFSGFLLRTVRVDKILTFHVCRLFQKDSKNRKNDRFSTFSTFLDSFLTSESLIIIRIILYFFKHLLS